MRLHVRLPCLVLLIATGSAQAAEVSRADAQASSFAVDYCGPLVGQDPARLTNAIRKFPGATLQAARPLADAPPAAVEPLVHALNVESSTPVHRITFGVATQGVRVVAYVTSGLEGCLTTVTGNSHVFELVSARLRQKDSGWNEIHGAAAGQRAWQRINGNEVVVTFTASTDSLSSWMAVTNHIDLLQPTLADFASFAEAVVKPCVKLAAATGAADPQVFGSHFTAEPASADGSVRLLSKVAIPGGQLQLTSTREGTRCVLGVYDTGYPHDYYLRALDEAFGRIAGAAHRSVHMSNRIDDTDGMLYVTIERKR